MNHCYSRYLTLQLTGRCILMQNVITKKNQHNDNFVELTPSFNKKDDPSMATRQASAIPQSLSGNSYYHRRFLNATSSSRQHLDTSSSQGLRSDTHIYAGDLLIRTISSSIPRRLRYLPMVDVTGIRTSYFDASERSNGALATMDEILQTMHWHDGNEVPALRRGEVPIGRLVVLCTYPTQTEYHKQGLPTFKGRCHTEVRVPCVSVSLPRALQSTVVVENAGVFFLNRRGSLLYHSDFESLQMAKTIAVRCQSVCTRTTLRPRVRDGALVGMQLVV
ncbi:unnamed protein product [Phytomonas sp. Hart1]|nr:unnamed protein product [Phytomonas sp. Hart1]|eukprot:CCW66839.1 unnamed protein product [Phytomonas sp. isolate Hart1]